MSKEEAGVSPVLKALIPLTIFGALWLLVEGVYALAMKGRPATSLLYQGYRAARDIARPVEPLTELLPEYVNDRGELDRLVDEFRISGVLLGNSPYHELAIPEARLTYIDPADQTPKNKPNLRLRAWQLRSRVFRSHDPVVVQKARDQPPLTPTVEAFLAKHGFREVVNTTNERGERLTLPETDAEKIALVIGDSVAYGTMVNDDETLASALQRRDPDHRYVNAGVPGNHVFHHLRILEQKLDEYGERVRRVVYVHCENDFVAENDRQPDPRMLADDLAALLDKRQIEDRVFIHTEYIYRSMPDHLRMPDRDLSPFLQRKRALMALARERFITVDAGALVTAERLRTGSLLAGFALYVDHCHYSPRGLDLLAEETMAAIESAASPEQP